MVFPILTLALSTQKCILRSPDDYSATLSPIYSCRSSSIWQQGVTPTSLGVINYTTKGGYQLAPRTQPPYPRQPAHGQQVTRFQLIHSSLSATAEHFVWAIHRLTSFKFRSLPSSFFVLPSIGSDEHVGMSICEVLWWVNLCVCVCLCACLSAKISPEPHARFLPNFVHVAYGRGSVLHRRCDMLCTSGIVDDVMLFSIMGSIVVRISLQMTDFAQIYLFTIK